MCIHLPSSWRAVCLRVNVSTHSLCAHVASMYKSIYLSVFLSVFIFQNAYRIMCVYNCIYICRTCILKQKRSNTIFSVLILFSY